MEKNKNTFPYEKNIITHSEKEILTPQVGDELIFCVSEDVALTSYIHCRDFELDPEYEPIEKVLCTDFFKLGSVRGKLCEPVYIGSKKFGFFGCRTRLSKTLVEGHFYLYEME